MNYLEIINKCLSELNFRQVSDFSELERPEHNKIKNYINITAQEVCLSQNWNFLLRRESLTLKQGECELQNTINGRILAIYIDKFEYKFCEDFQNFLRRKKSSKMFSIFNDKLLFPAFEEEKLINIIYYTRNIAVSAEGTEKSRLENPDDLPLIPEQFAEQILVYGTCLRLKAEPEHVKFSFWQDMYNSAIASMRSKIAVDADYSPSVRLYRR